MSLRRVMASVAIAVLARSAIAQESKPFRLSYAAAPSCPSEETFSKAIESDSAKSRRAAPGEAALDVEASVGPDGAAFLGVLRIRRPDGTETRRIVPAASCGEVVSAMAFIAAVALNPDATLATPEKPSDGATLPDNAGAPPGQADSPPAPAPTTKPALSAAPTTKAPLAGPGKGAADAHRSWWFGASAGVGVISAMAPSVSPDLAIAVGVDSARKDLLSPLFRLSGHFAESSESPGSGGTAQFRRLAGRLTACPAAVDFAPVILRPCGLFEVGQLRAAGSGVNPSLTSRILWLELGATVRAELRVAGPLLAMTEIGAVFPLVRDSFYFVPDQVVYTIPAVGFLGALELGIRI